MSTADLHDLEERTLCSLWKDQTDFRRAQADGLTPDHFTAPRMKLWFEETDVALATADDPKATPFDCFTASMFARSAEPDEITNAVRVDSLQRTSSGSNRFVATLLRHREAALLRGTLARAALRLKQEGHVALDEIRADLSAATTAAIPGARRGATLTDAALAAVDAIDNPPPRVGTGFEAFDRLATPIACHELVVLGGRPGEGKSAFALQVARRFAERRPVAFFSLEMTAAEIAERCALQALGFDGAGEHPRSIAARRKWLQEQAQRRSQLHIYDCPPLTAATIRQRAEELSRRPDGLGLIVVDYLQLLTPSPALKGANREQQVASMSRELKLTAMALKVPVLLLAQLSRGVEKDERRPRLSDLRESGAIEQDADRVWFLHAEANDTELIQAKCRGGPQGVAKRLNFHRSCVSFSET